MNEWPDCGERRKMSREYQEILEKLHNIDIRLELNTQKIDQNHKSNKDSQASIFEIIEKITKTIYGNGHPGLTTRINSVEKLEIDFKSHIISDRWFGGIMVTVLLAILGVVLKIASNG